ncbi:hypothetical protein K1719_010287 [Acacia pycnantha]|nr:hypothetical protein K1719_010287 [Acacia pycnantha]
MNCRIRLPSRHRVKKGSGFLIHAYVQSYCSNFHIPIKIASAFLSLLCFGQNLLVLVAIPVLIENIVGDIIDLGTLMSISGFEFKGLVTCVNHKVIAKDEWWDRKIQENPDYAKYKYHGIKFARELEIVFKDGMASGSTQFSPSTRRQMPPRDEEDDVYRPTMDLEEGSGDSEEELPGATTGVSAPLEGLNLTMSTQPSAPSGSTSIGKRKRG